MQKDYQHSWYRPIKIKTPSTPKSSEYHDLGKTSRLRQSSIWTTFHKALLNGDGPARTRHRNRVLTSNQPKSLKKNKSDSGASKGEKVAILKSDAYREPEVRGKHD
jgi:hypothetical protein